MRWWILAFLIPACEKANSAETEPPPAPAPVPPPAVAPPPKLEPKVEPPTVSYDREPMPRLLPPEHVDVAPGLPPSPITDRTVYDPVAYDAWLAKLTRAQRAQVDRICKKDKLDFHPECDGIGPLHIPVPPLPRAEVEAPAYSAFVTMDAWELALSPAQQRYRDQQCSAGDALPSTDLCGENTPLVVTFDGAIDFTRRARFAFIPGQVVDTAWPSAPWLALDRDGNGTIDSGAELFGNHTRLPDGHLAANGFAALAALDANGDGVIDPADPDFAKLVLWGEAITPASAQIASISLAYTRELRCDADRNCEGERATVKLRDGRSATVVDVYIPLR